MRVSLASLYNHLCHFQSENVLGKTIFDTVQATISLKNRRFDEKSATKSRTAGTHIEAQISAPSKVAIAVKVTRTL